MIYHETAHGILHQGDCLDVLKTLPSESVNCCVTSPPYWGLRDYGHKDQLGLETTIEQYIDKLCDIFDEVGRVLRKDGTLWVNLGDTYSTVSGNQGKTLKYGGMPKFSDAAFMSMPEKKKTKLAEKSLCLIPMRFAIEMQNRGWIIRNTIIWHKPNCMPSSAKDRFTVDFEYLFFITKSGKYWFDQQYEPAKYDGRKDTLNKGSKKYSNMQQPNNQGPQTMAARGHERWVNKDEQGNYLRNKRAVWTIPTKPYRAAHFATYPPALIDTPIKAGCPVGGTVIDPFFGAGTTGLVAQRLGRKWIGIDLNDKYCKIAIDRIESDLDPWDVPRKIESPEPK